MLSPLLFLFYVNSASDNIPKSVNSAMYADDVSLWASHRCKKSASGDIQQAVDSVSEWNRKKMILNIEKSEVAFFSTNTREANWQPTVWLNSKTVPFNGSPCLLGVQLDRTLPFSFHTEMVCKKATSSSFGVSGNKGMEVPEEYDEEGLHQSYPKLSGFCCSCLAPVAEATRF